MAIENLSEKVAKYAAEKTNVLMTSLVSQAFEDGYRMGYQDREDEIPVVLRDDITEYIDLGLPSGTLWAKDYEKKDGEVVYLPYCQASKLSIPTKEQIEELMSCCKWEADRSDNIYSGPLSLAKCIGPNGRVLYFSVKGRIKSDEIIESREVYIWGIDDEKKEKPALNISTDKEKFKMTIQELFTGNKIPVRLVKSK